MLTSPRTQGMDGPETAHLVPKVVAVDGTGTSRSNRLMCPKRSLSAVYVVALISLGTYLLISFGCVDCKSSANDESRPEAARAELIELCRGNNEWADVSICSKLLYPRDTVRPRVYDPEYAKITYKDDACIVTQGNVTCVLPPIDEDEDDACMTVYQQVTYDDDAGVLLDKICHAPLRRRLAGTAPHWWSQ